MERSEIGGRRLRRPREKRGTSIGKLGPGLGGAAAPLHPGYGLNGERERISGRIAPR